MRLARSDQPWYVLQSAPQREELALSKLTKAGFHVYLPRYKVDIHNRRKGTWRQVDKILLTGYLFIAVPRGDFLTARECDGVLGFVGACGVPERVSGAFVERFQIMEQDGVFDQLRGKATAKRDRLKKEFTKGSEVQIKLGPFTDFMAIVEEVTERAKVKVSFQLFGREMGAEIEAEHLSAA